MRTWDIFCKVIDNYGDIGVSWRLARSLAHEQGARVRLWVDDLAAFQRIRPEIQPDRAQQLCEEVTVCVWRQEAVFGEPAEAVIEAFGCTLPDVYVAAMAARMPPPVWINLEYLSAESWVGAHHGLPSPHPQLPLTKYFFFPGYTRQTGGLLRERDLLARRSAFVQLEIEAYWRALGLAAPVPGEWRISLFAYENPALAELLDAWRSGADPVTLLVPEGRILPQLAKWLGLSALQAGDVIRRDALQVMVLPFASQDDYDRLLWACDLNFVRGEDSCVRAQWAARPLVWQAYPQAESVHHDKLEALLALYTEGLEPLAAQAVRDAWRCWNGVPGAPDMAACWAGWRAQRDVLGAHAAVWQARLADQPGLVETLVEFVENKRPQAV
ncbi:elongation factor P maturation arginine rhamnosyltransferase EarP [Thiobacillus sp.]|uniref:elongation factor P maturation arginine rhamnosyltransferase EarP n=1 Tax=Thiobacillus sp. TaxID=924 RepID=UPI0027ED02CE|nr:elongation factor P maturation arginine rhamnosyltransferase EarP [Thiobacillus sp.]